MRNLVLVVLTGFFSVVACGDDDKPGDGNNRIVERYPGGGAGGGAIDGKFSLFVENSSEDGVVQDATVVVEGGGKTLTAKTNAEGRVDFDDAALKGPISLHIFHADYVYESLVNLNASVATFGITKTTPPMMPMVQTATLKGAVEGWDLITETPKLAFVNAVGEDIVSITQTERAPPNNAFRTNVAADFPGVLVAHDYELVFDIRAKALLIEAGPLIMGSYEPQFVGFASGISATAGATVMKDVAFTHKLDQTVTVSVSGPMGLGSPGAGLVVKLPGDAGRVNVGFGDGAMVNFLTPALNGSLAGAKLIAFGEMEAMSGMDRTGALSVREVSGMSAALTLQPLPGKPTVMGRTVSAAEVSGAELHQFAVTNTNGGFLWNVSVVGGSIATFPAVPAGFTERLTGALNVTVSALNFGTNVDSNNAKFEELGVDLFDSSDSRTQLTF